MKEERLPKMCSTGHYKEKEGQKEEVEEGDLVHKWKTHIEFIIGDGRTDYHEKRRQQDCEGIVPRRRNTLIRSGIKFNLMEINLNHHV
jgi:hypothetical protein